MKHLKRIVRWTSAAADSRSLLEWAALCLVALAGVLLPVRAQQSAAQPQHSQAASAPAASSYDKPNAKAFSSPEIAVAALCDAVRKNDPSALMLVLGPDAKELVHWTTDKNDMEEQRTLFLQKFDRLHRLVKEPDGTVALYVGAENWPLPIPIIEYQGAWYFDANLGKQEILYRRIGHNEIAALQVSRTLIDAEKEYFGISRKFTNRFVSSPDAHDGLYWKSSDAVAHSPIGPYLAQAGVADSAADRRPFHGYFYRILLQVPVAPDGDTNDRAGASGNNFVIVAFPAEYRSSGVMTFVTNQSGESYEKDLGASTSSSALLITSAQLNSTWKKVE